MPLIFVKEIRYYKEFNKDLNFFSIKRNKNLS